MPFSESDQRDLRTLFRGNDLKELVSLSKEGTTVILDEVGRVRLPCPMLTFW